MVSSRIGSKILTIGVMKKEVVMKGYKKSSKTVKARNQGSDPLENGPGVTIVRCPHLKTCQFGEVRPKFARNRCRGVVCQVNHWEACLLMVFKCPRQAKRIMVEVKGDEIRHIIRHSSEYQEVLPRLNQLFCQECEYPVLDYCIVYGDAILDVKCRRDGHVSSHSIK
jgi:hypothetical protein